MSKSIAIKEVISDKSSDFNIKRFKLGSLNVDEPLKTIDAKNVNKEFFEELKRGFKNILLETSKLVDSNTVNNILTNTSDEEIKNIFGYKKWQHEYDNLISATFEFNPYLEFQKIENIIGYFDYYYEFSKSALLIPNIKVKKNEYKLEKNKKLKKIGEKQIIDCKNYIKYVDDVFDIFDYKNNKYIFVPLSLKFDINDVQKLAEQYIKKEYFNIWVDFEGATSTDLTKLSKIRSFNRIIDDLKRYNDVVIYSTNIRREITSNKEMDASPSSDVLTPLNGSNIIGVNREPRMGGGDGGSKTKEERDELKKHKSRVFNSNSYYYTKTNVLISEEELHSKLLNHNYNILLNSKLISDEFTTQKEQFIKNSTIKDYISDKQMINEYKDGFLKKTLFQKGKQTNLGKFSIPI